MLTTSASETMLGCRNQACRILWSVCFKFVCLFVFPSRFITEARSTHSKCTWHKHTGIIFSSQVSCTMDGAAGHWRFSPFKRLFVSSLHQLSPLSNYEFFSWFESQVEQGAGTQRFWFHSCSCIRDSTGFPDPTPLSAAHVRPPARGTVAESFQLGRAGSKTPLCRNSGCPSWWDFRASSSPADLLSERELYVLCSPSRWKCSLQTLLPAAPGLKSTPPTTK